MPRKPDVVITGMGVLSPVGLSVGGVMETLASGASGIGLWQSPMMAKKFPAGIVPGDFLPGFAKLEQPYLDRCSQLAILAADQAINDAKVETFADYGQRAALFYGSVRGGAQKEEEWYEQLLVQHKQAARPFSLFAIMLNAAAAQISIRRQILGPVITNNTACSSSGTAIGCAYQAILDGSLDIAVAGYGCASDGYHIGSPKAEGEAAAMRAALADAQLAPGEIDYLNAHATATRGGDAVEAAAIRMAFGPAAADLPVSSTKAVHGHLLGATSVLELMICVGAITESFLPATAHLEDVDPECTLNHIAGAPLLGRPVKRAMSFSSGLGGTNVALIVAGQELLPGKRCSKSSPTS